MRLTVTVNLLGMRLFEVKKDTLDLSVDDQPTLSQIFDLVEVENPGFKQAILDGAGGLSKRIAVLINGDNVQYRGGLDVTLQANDVINIIPAVAGG